MSKETTALLKTFEGNLSAYNALLKPYTAPDDKTTSGDDSNTVTSSHEAILAIEAAAATSQSATVFRMNRGPLDDPNSASNVIADRIIGLIVASHGKIGWYDAAVEEKTSTTDVIESRNTANVTAAVDLNLLGVKEKEPIRPPISARSAVLAEATPEKSALMKSAEALGNQEKLLLEQKCSEVFMPCNRVV